MDLRTWRRREEHSLADLARLLGLDGRNPAARVQRWETGEARAPADIEALIVDLTGGEVTLADQHRTRLAFLERRRGASSALRPAGEARARGSSGSPVSAPPGAAASRCPSPAAAPSSSSALHLDRPDRPAAPET